MSSEVKGQHFWVGKRGTDDCVCQNCGKLSKDCRLDNLTDCKPETSKPINHADRETFEKGIELVTGDKIQRLVFADWLDEQGDKDYALAMRSVPNWVVAKKWSASGLEVPAQDLIVPDHVTPPQWYRSTYPPWVDQVRDYINNQSLRIRCILWVNYLSYLFDGDFSEFPPVPSQILNAFPSADPLTWLDSLVYVLKEADPRV